MNISSITDEEVYKLATPIWDAMKTGSNNIDYDYFSFNFSDQFRQLVTKEKFEKQCKEFELLTSLGSSEPIACIRRDIGVTVIFRVLSTKLKGEFVGQIQLEGDANSLKVTNAQVY